MNPPTAPGAAALLGGSQGPQKTKHRQRDSRTTLIYILHQAESFLREFKLAAYSAANLTKSRMQEVL